MAEMITRRSIVRTGAKLAYTAPLVAASMRVQAAGASLVSGGQLDCVGSACLNRVTLGDGSQVCASTVAPNAGLCCESNADCPEFAPTCVRSYQSLRTNVLEAVECPTDPTKGRCSNVSPC